MHVVEIIRRVSCFAVCVHSVVFAAQSCEYRPQAAHRRGVRLYAIVLHAAWTRDSTSGEEHQDTSPSPSLDLHDDRACRFHTVRLVVSSSCTDLRLNHLAPLQPIDSMLNLGAVRVCARCSPLHAACGSSVVCHVGVGSFHAEIHSRWFERSPALSMRRVVPTAPFPHATHL